MTSAACCGESLLSGRGIAVGETRHRTEQQRRDGRERDGGSSACEGDVSVAHATYLSARLGQHRSYLSARLGQHRSSQRDAFPPLNVLRQVTPAAPLSVLGSRQVSLRPHVLIHGLNPTRHGTKLV